LYEKLSTIMDKMDCSETGLRYDVVPSFWGILMEMVELSQKEIRALITFMESRDVEEWSEILDLPELITLHTKLRESQTY
jgi:hypothetical protein